MLKGNTLRTYIWPFVQALLFHAVVFVLFLYNWQSAPEANVPTPPVIINAKILTLAEPPPSQQKAEADKIRQQKLKEEEKRKQVAQQKEDEQKEKRLIEKRRKQEEEKRKKIARQKAEKEKAEKEKAELEKKKREEERKKAEELARQEQERQRQAELEKLLAQQREQDLSSALAAESDFIQEQADAEAAMSYASLIRERVKQHWHRPLSARNGMQTILVIHLVPTGEVSNVYVKEGSGDAAFDRSAILAVQRAEKFEELQQLSPSAFDAHFRQFNFIFRPEDLVR